MGWLAVAGLAASLIVGIVFATISGAAPPSPCAPAAFATKKPPLPCVFHCLGDQGSTFALRSRCLRD